MTYTFKLLRIESMKKMGLNRNCTIDILRLFFSILVVAIHTSPFIEYNAILSYFCSQTVSRLAIPFFAGVAGYFYFKDKSKGKNKKYLKKYTLIYSFWSAVMFTFDATRWTGSVSSFVLYVLKAFFLIGWRQLWYLLAIIYVICLLALGNRISYRFNNFIYFCSFVFLAYEIAVNNYGKLFSTIHTMSIIEAFFQNSFVNLPMILPFFMLGYALNRPIPVNYNKHAFLIALSCIVGLLLEILLTTLFDLHENVVLCLFTYPSVYFLLIWVLNNPYPNLGAAAKYCSRMASIIYLSHSPLQAHLVSNGFTPSLVFLICILIPGLMGFILTKIDNPMFNKFI